MVFYLKFHTTIIVRNIFMFINFIMVLLKYAGNILRAQYIEII